MLSLLVLIEIILLLVYLQLFLKAFVTFREKYLYLLQKISPGSLRLLKVGQMFKILTTQILAMIFFLLCLYF